MSRRGSLSGAVRRWDCGHLVAQLARHSLEAPDRWWQGSHRQGSAVRIWPRAACQHPLRARYWRACQLIPHWRARLRRYQGLARTWPGLRGSLSLECEIAAPFFFH